MEKIDLFQARKRGKLDYINTGSEMVNTIPACGSPDSRLPRQLTCSNQRGLSVRLSERIGAILSVRHQPRSVRMRISAGCLSRHFLWNQHVREVSIRGLTEATPDHD